MHAEARALSTFEGETLIARVRCPKLVIAGAETELTARRLPSARFVTIRSAGHSIVLESTQSFDAVVGFLRGA